MMLQEYIEKGLKYSFPQDWRWRVEIKESKIGTQSYLQIGAEFRLPEKDGEVGCSEYNMENSNRGQLWLIVLNNLVEEISRFTQTRRRGFLLPPGQELKSLRGPYRPIFQDYGWMDQPAYIGQIPERQEVLVNQVRNPVAEIGWPPLELDYANIERRIQAYTDQTARDIQDREDQEVRRLMDGALEKYTMPRIQGLIDAV